MIHPFSRLPAAHSLRSLALSLIACTLVCAAHAHVTLEHPVASAARPYKAVFKIGHGCGTSPTRVVEVHIPTGVRGTRPMPKAGWTLEVVRQPLTTPYTHHGQTVRDDVALIRWTASSDEHALASAHYDEFTLVATLPSSSGKLYWPVRQQCVQGQLNWTDVPKAGQRWADLPSPAAELELMPAAAHADHAH